MREPMNDVYVKRARSEGYRSRASYKLLEIAERDKLLRQGMTVVDLGATPGGWSQVARAQVGSGGQVYALDILEMEPLPGVNFMLGDFRDETVEAQLSAALAGRPIDLVLSDMSPNIAMSDQARAMHLAELALAFAVKHLKPGGSFLVKVFQGSGFQEFFKEMQRGFEKVSARKPEASRGRSNELDLRGSKCRVTLPAVTGGEPTELQKRV